MTANQNYDLLVSQIYKNTCAGFTLFTQPSTNTANDIYTYEKPISIHIKTFTNIEEGPLLKEQFLKTLVSQKLKYNDIISESSESPWVFYTNDPVGVLHGNLVDGMNNFRNPELKFNVLFTNSRTSINVIFLTYKLLRITSENIFIINS